MQLVYEHLCTLIDITEFRETFIDELRLQVSLKIYVIVIRTYTSKSCGIVERRLKFKEW